MYCYADFRPETLTDEGQRTLLRVRDKASELLRLAGAVTSSKLMPSGDTWLALAFVDRLVELGELRPVAGEGGERIFVGNGGLSPSMLK